jgi:hypothetical protein
MSLGTISGAMGTGAIQLLSAGYMKTHYSGRCCDTACTGGSDGRQQRRGLRASHLDFEKVRANGSTIGDNIPSRNRVSSNSSMIGFRGTEHLAAT